MRLFATGFVVLAAGVAGGIGIALLSHTDQRTRTVFSTTSKVEVGNGSRSAGPKPAPIPTRRDGAVNPHRLVLSSAVPIDANLDSAEYVDRKPPQLILAWDRAYLTRDRQAAIWQRRGFAIWQLDRGNTSTWHRVYTYETLVNNQVGVEGFGVSLGDISGDGRPEVLVFFDTDGSAGGGTYHLFVSSGRRVVQPLVRSLTMDQGTITFGKNALHVLEGVDFRGPGSHCCYRNVRETWLRWNGRRLITVREVVRKNLRGWPPG
jgi:hypothetical protein